MYHLFSWDPIMDLFTNIKCLQANPFAVRFAAYCSRSATDAWGKSQGEGADERDLVRVRYPGFFENVLPFYY